MNSRERVLCALDHREPDRIPIDIGASRVTGIGAIAYKRLLADLGRSEAVRVYDLKQQLAELSPAMIDLLGGDVVQVHRLAPSTGMSFLHIDAWKDGVMTDGSPCLVPSTYEPAFLPDGTIEIHHQGALVARRTPGALYFDLCATPLASATTPADLDAFVFPDAWSEREERFLRAQIEALYHGTDKALFAGLPLMCCSFFEISLALFGFNHFMELLACERELVEHWLDRLLAHQLEILDRFLAIAGPYIHVIQLNDDFGAQNSLQISPRTYRQLFKPRQRTWIEFVKARTKAKVFIHCDGAIEEILPDFIEIGIDILNPLQTSAKGMDPLRIKTTYGKDLSFWGGGVETQSTLPFGTVDALRDEVRERMAMLGTGGGYIFATIHNIQPDIPPEKIRAIYDTAAACRSYQRAQG
jgi:uroporphyrinogen decarboxylase